MHSNRKVIWITYTAVLTALLIVIQATTAPLGMPLVTGSAVNLILIVSVMTGGFSSGLAVAVLSPVIAKLFGIGPLWVLIPFIIAGNLAIIALWHFIGKRESKNIYITYIPAVIIGAVGKFMVLYFGIVRLALPMFVQLPAKQTAVIVSSFSVSQLFTALIGGTLAVLILPVLKKAIKSPSFSENS